MNDGGFILAENIVALALLAIIAAAATTAVVAVTTTSKTSDDRVTAANLAQQDVQAARALRYPAYPAAVKTHAVKVGTTSYQVSRTVGTPCPATPNYSTNPYMTVTSTVTWPPASASTRVVVTAELAC